MPCFSMNNPLYSLTPEIKQLLPTFGSEFTNGNFVD